jgi:copper resistance protein B
MLIAASASAQHAGHTAEPGPEPTPEQGLDEPHAGHAKPLPPAPRHEATDPHASHDPGAQHDPAAVPPAAPPPPAALSGPAHAADALFDPVQMADARRQLRAEEGAARNLFVLADRLEASFANGDEDYAWDVQGWYGGDIHKLWLKSEGAGEPGDGTDRAEVQALYSRAFTSFFDAQFGVRYDVRPEPDRSYLVAGVQGLLPYVFELDAALFLSDEGDLSGRVESEYDLQITQRMILQPRIEIDFAAQDVPELGIGSGLASFDAGLRLRYEIRREVAPYVGVAWERKLGDTADFARAAGEDRGDVSLVLGARFWF